MIFLDGNQYTHIFTSDTRRSQQVVHLESESKGGGIVTVSNRVYLRLSQIHFNYPTFGFNT